MSYPLLTLISIFFVFIPMALSARAFKTLMLARVMFFLFVIGFMTELFMTLDSTHFFLRDRVFDLYCLVECSLFIWIVRQRVNMLTRSSFLKGALLFALPLWLLCLFVYPFIGFSVSGTALFNMLYEVVIAFYAGMELLKMVESKTELTSSPPFWILVGIFFYCFSTFFLMSLLNTGITRDIWYVNNIINIVTYTIYTVGLWQAHSFKVSKRPDALS